MRDAILDYLEANIVLPYKVTRNLPWMESQDSPLYIKNLLSIYVDVRRIVQEPLYDGLDNHASIDQFETFVIYVANDAQKLPTNYDDTVETIMDARLILTDGRIERLSQVAVEYIGKVVLTTFDISSLKLINNNI